MATLTVRNAQPRKQTNLVETTGLWVKQTQAGQVVFGRIKAPRIEDQMPDDVRQALTTLAGYKLVAFENKFKGNDPKKPDFRLHLDLMRDDVSEEQTTPQDEPAF
jgi:hypothetical protein